MGAATLDDFVEIRRAGWRHVIDTTRVRGISALEKEKTPNTTSDSIGARALSNVF